jgi:hypothetical protein
MSFSISGIDLVLEVPREALDPRLILDLVQDRWPEGVFQDANEDDVRPVKAVLAEESELKTREFFIYQDEASAKSWGQDGRTPANGNRMLHFLIQDDPAGGAPARITMVIGEVTPEMTDLFSALGSALGQGGLRGKSNGTTGGPGAP